MEEKYKIEIYERYRDLLNAGKTAKTVDNNDLWKIFEYFTCIELSKEYKRNFYEYYDIDLNFKEENRLSRIDTGIDCCDLIDTIVQCKLRSKSLTWGECGTFFGSQTAFCKKQNKPILRWPNLIIARNNDCTLSDSLLYRADLFIDKKYRKKDLIDYCEKLYKNPPKYPKIEDTGFKLRDYQKDCIQLIDNSKKNVIVSLPTGTGKNVVMIYTFEKKSKYLILVPRIVDE